MNEDLGKTLSEILGDKYIIPLYQRNFAWRTEEIHQLLQDIYEVFSNNQRKQEKRNYYIGSLVVLKRHSGDYEVIDGQQRLTVISLIAMLLKDQDGAPVLRRPVLFYDSRPEVQEFFELLCKQPKGPEDALNLSAPSLYYLKEAYEFIQDAKANLPDGKGDNKKYLEYEGFPDFFLNHVVLVRNEIPEDTDVAAYFEIMNNRGEQLQKHEIVKAQMMDQIRSKCENGEIIYDSVRQGLFSRIWDVCSQMDIPVHRLLSERGERERFFGRNFDVVSQDCFESVGSVCETKPKSPGYRLSEILGGQAAADITKGKEHEEETETEIYSYSSIIDFPNFLMHVLRLYCDVQREKAKNANIPLNENVPNVPLNEKYLLDVYAAHEKANQIDSMEFIKLLLFGRVAFDRFIVKTMEDADDQEDGRKWVLVKPTRKESNSNWWYSSSFAGNPGKQLIKALSMLQVTFRTRIYKTWLYDALKWIYDQYKVSGKFSSISAEAYLGFLHGWILDYYAKQKYAIPRIPEGESPSSENSYSQGVNTPHFLLNFIDYLFCCKEPERFLDSFEFKYWNSVEHHLARNNGGIDNLGNLCLVGKSVNSRLSDRDVREKVQKYGKGNMGPNRQIMYKETETANYTWEIEQIRKHYNDLVDLLEAREQYCSKIIAEIPKE